jgi:cytoskeletal protein CcmA (bactofilin family)
METNTNLNEVSRLSEGAVFKGEITTPNDIRIDGQVEGCIKSKGRIVVGENAKVNGDIICTNVDFSGTMNKGTFYVQDTLSLKPGCSVDGDLRFKRLQVDLDAKFNGNCRVLSEKEFEQVAKTQGIKTPVQPKEAPKAEEAPAAVETPENNE